MTDIRHLTFPTAAGASPEVPIDWRQEGACRGEDPSLFFAPDGPEHPAERAARIRIARSICAECPVAALCDQYATATRQRYGIWAGRDEDDRLREIRRQRRWVRHGGESRLRPASSASATCAGGAPA
ncbi:WhiB family transcriptional regulator [Cellulomonas denverensis]|uniref:Transcriptional regulator WhiB n=1 Tax=Cellulomonas denverensis TaxID=264297 RepID=A0A7X6QYJ7_9CELL|nr:WhiB family transcriptional regulator [Cellulomonas denverensis]NKY22193.1 WhiB family transcriptional regulator [Cellulomonas denverensis]GIG27156.1 transcriptional regulator WhiB [Cellulomonas denverensis]